jgi:hypothetical protein
VAPGRFRRRHAADRVALAAHQLRIGEQGVVTDQVFVQAEDHPTACPWCGRSRIRGILPSPDGNRWYRCGACATTFFLTPHSADREALAPTERPDSRAS